MKTVFQTSDRPRDIVLGWNELARILKRSSGGLRQEPPNWLAALPCWKVAGIRVWDYGDVCNALAMSKPASVRTIRRDPTE